MADDDTKEENNKHEISVAQKVRMERNRQRALLLRSSRLTSHPYNNDTQAGNKSHGQRINVGGSRVVDSGAGFFVEENDLVEEQEIELVQEPGNFAIVLKPFSCISISLQCGNWISIKVS